MMSVRRELTLMKNNQGCKENKNKSNGAASKLVSPLFVLTAGSLWGLMGLLVRSLNEVGLSSAEIGFVRASVAFVCMLIALLIFDRKALKIKLKDIWCFIGTGAFSVAFFNFCYFKTMTLTSLSVAAVLLYTAPAFVMLMSAVLFKEKLTAQKLLALVLAFVGCAFVSGIVGGAGALSLQGILYGLGAGIGYALYSIFGRYALDRNYSSVTISFYTFLFATVSTFFFVDSRAVFSCVGSSWQLLLKTVILVLVVTLLPYLSYTRGLQGMENGTASVLASIEPVVATLVGIFVYKESLNIWNGIGICLVLGSIVLINLKRTGR
ncbi:MAG: DMT family transporter [Bacillota bacterium]|nr:DMT family transporter [Bacillota bacterium]